MSIIKKYKKTTQDVVEQAQSMIDRELTEEVYLMPDAHVGKGCSIGSVFKFGKNFDVNTIGADIGCGMSWLTLPKQMTSLENEDTLKLIMEKIIERIPMGFDFDKQRNNDSHKTPVLDPDCFLGTTKIEWLRTSEEPVARSLGEVPEKFHKHLGTLGSGNHFIEIGKCEETGEYALVVHSGSRGFGNHVNKKYQEPDTKMLKKELNDTINKLKNPRLSREDKDILITKKFQLELKLEKAKIDLSDYIEDQELAVLFAKFSRSWMLATIYETVIEVIKKDLKGELENWNSIMWSGFYFAANKKDCIHNYWDVNSNVIRKGAINAESGMDALIPLNPRDGFVTGIGKGNEDWMNSAPHGAGRIASRRKFVENNKLEDTLKEMNGIVNNMSQETLDESPLAYRSYEVLENIGETLSDIKHWKTLLNIKGQS